MPTKVLLIAVLWCIALSTAGLGRAPDTTKPADMENMKKIGAALHAFKKAKGEFPEHLSDLVPDYLEAAVLVSPLGEKADPRAAAREYDPKLPCSYSYEWCKDAWPDLKDVSVRDVRQFQLEQFGDVVPLLRCRNYKQTLNLSHAGDIFSSVFEKNPTYQGDWLDSEEVKQLIAKHGHGPGGPHGRKLVFTLADQEGHPMAGAVLEAEVSGWQIRPDKRNFTAGADGRITIPLGYDRHFNVGARGIGANWYVPSFIHYYESQNADADGNFAEKMVAYPAASIGGTVVDAAGAPVEGAHVELSHADTTRGPDDSPRDVVVANTTTDQRGAWKIEGVPKAGVPLLLWVEHPKHVVLQGKLGTGGVPTAAELFGQHSQIALAAPFAKKGTVLAAGKPVRGVKVYGFGAPWHDVHWANGSAETDAEGQFTIVSHVRGPGVVAVMSKDHAPLCQYVEFSAERPLALALEEGRVVEGQLIDDSRNGFARAHLLLDALQTPGGTWVRLPEEPVLATTDENGRFTWRHAPRLSLSFDVLPEHEWKRNFLCDLTNQDFGVQGSIDEGPMEEEEEDEDE